MKKVTIVTVCFNAQDCLEKTISSVIEQTCYKDIEYIIIDGNSKDNTLTIIKKYESQVHRWISEPDKGIYDAMNKAITFSTGEWINFMNAGDYFYDKNVVEKIFINDRFSNVDVVFGDLMVNMGTKQTLRKGILYPHKFPHLSHQAVFVRTALMKKHLFNLKYKISADYEFLYSLYREGRVFSYENIIVANYNVEGLSSNKKCQLYKEHCEIDGRKVNQLKLLKYKFESLLPNNIVSFIHYKLSK